MHNRTWLLYKNNITMKILFVFFVFVYNLNFTGYLCIAGDNSRLLRGCGPLPCSVGEQCVTKKFWCDKPPCPIMTYCSNSRKEALKGPERCDLALCPQGYRCVVQISDCRWGQKCKNQAARCVTESEFKETPVNCADVTCPSGHLCILKEMNCYRAPCRLTKSCAKVKDAGALHDKCKKLGCHSEYECFLRKPPPNCNSPSCGYIPDCINDVKFYEGLESQHCHGWICPSGQECVGQTVQIGCKGDNCALKRECREIILDATNNSTDYQEDHLFASPNHLLSTFVDTATEVSTDYKNLASRETNPNFDSSPHSINLKRKTVGEAVHYWAEISENKGNYEEFSKWMKSLRKILDNAVYKQWINELNQTYSKIPEFQTWLNRLTQDDNTKGLTFEQRKDVTSAFIKQLMQTSPTMTSEDDPRETTRHHQLQPLGLINFDFNQPSSFNQNLKSHSRTGIPMLLMPPLAYHKDLEEFQEMYKTSDLIPLPTSNQHLWIPSPEHKTATKIPNFDEDHRVPFPQFEPMLDNISEDMKKLSPGLHRIGKNESLSHLVLMSTENVEKHDGPNILVYFPIPYNFYIYISTDKRNSTGKQNISLPNNIQNEQEIVDEPKVVVNETGTLEDCCSTSTSTEKPPELSETFDNNLKNSSLPMNKTEEFHDFLKKIIDGLVKHWEEEEKSLATTGAASNNNDKSVVQELKQNVSDKHPTLQVKGLLDRENEGVKPTVSDHHPPLRMKYLLNRENDNKKVENDDEKAENDDEKVKNIFKEFIDWLDSNYFNSTTTPIIPTEEFPKEVDKNVRILVDVDKSSDLYHTLRQNIDKMASKDGKNVSNPQEYLVIVNLKDVVDENSEDLITRKLHEMSKKRSSRNSPNDQKDPTILWVVPSYDEDGSQAVRPKKSNEVFEAKVGFKEEPSSTLLNGESKNINNIPLEKTIMETESYDQDSYEDDGVEESGEADS